MNYRKILEEALKEAQKITGYEIKQLKEPKGEPFPSWDDHLRPIRESGAEKFWIKTK